MRRLLVLSAILLLVAGTAFGQEKKSPYQGYLDRALEYFQANEYDRAIREISKVLSSKNTEELAAAYYVRGACQRQKGDLQAAAADLEKALQYKKDWLSPLEILGVVYAADADAAVRMQKGLPSLSRAAVLQSKSPAVYEALARLSVERKNLAQAVRWLDLALHWGAEAFSLLETDPGLGVLRDTEYGRVLLAHRKEYQEARATFKQAIEAGNRNDHARALDLLGRCIPGLVASVGPGGAALGEAHFNLGLSHALRGAFGEAIEPYEKALAIRVEMQGARSIGAAEIHKCIAAALANAGDAARALAHYREVLAIMVALFGENDPGTAQACEQAGTLLARLGDHAQAISYHERALSIRTRVLGAAHPDTLTSMEKIAGVLSERGDHEKAIALGQKALDLRLAAAEGVPTRALADSYEVLALICMRKKDYLKAVSLLTQAIGMRRTVLGDYHEDTARAFEGRAVAYKGLVGKQYLAASREDYLKAYTIRLKVLGPDHADTLAAEKQIGILYAAERGGKDWLVPYLESLIRAKTTALGEGDRQTIESWLALGDAQRDALDYAAAIASFRSALAASERAAGGEDLLSATCRQKLGDALGLKGEYGAAAEQFEKAYRILVRLRGERHPDVAALCGSLGRAYLDAGDFTKAREFYSRGLAIALEAYGERDPRAAELRGFLGDLSLAMGDIEAAEEQYRKALAVQEEVLGRDHLDTARTWCGMGDALRARGDAEKAVSFYLSALDVYRKANGERDPQVAKIYGYIASAYFMRGQFDESLAYEKKALAILQAFFGEDDFKTAAACNNIATSYWESGDYNKAIEYFEKAILGYLKAVGENHPHTVRIYGNLAKVAAVLERYEDARRYGEIALRAGGNVYGRDHPAVAGFLNDLGLVSALSGDLAGAIPRYEQALAIARRAGVRDDVVAYANNLGWAHADLHDFAKARASFEQAIAAVEQARGELGSGKTQFMARNISSYYGSLAASADLGDIPSFFRTAESLRARGFLDRLSLAAALSAAGVPANQSAELIALSNDIESLASRRNAEVQKPEKDRDAGALQALSRDLDDREKRFAALEAKLLVNERFQALRKPRIAEIGEAQAMLRDSTAILEYVIWEVSDRKSLDVAPERSFCLVIRKGSARIVPLDGKFDYGGAVEEFRGAILNAPDRAAKPASALYAALIGPVEAELRGCTDLVIVPDGSLAFLPFDALRKTPSDPFLAERWTITLAPSVSVMQMLGQRANGGDDRRRMLGFGGGVYSPAGESTDRGRGKRGATEKDLTTVARSYAAKRGGKEGAGRYFDGLGIEWANLPGTSREVMEIGSRVFGGSGVTLFTGRDVTERRLKDLSAAGDLERYRVVHLACHGYYDQTYPSFSSVVFSEVSRLADTGEDGYLSVEEAAELRLRADLVNLSACETGLGTVVAGDGVTGLARAFQVAGANHVGVTLWQVADDGTKEFMVGVYRRYAAGASLRDAIAATKREFIASAEYGDPYYWSPFVLYGD